MIKRFIITILFIFTACSPKESAQDLHSKAEALYNRPFYNKAKNEKVISYLEEALEVDPTYAPTYDLLFETKCYKIFENDHPYEKVCLEYYNRAIKKNVRNVRTIVGEYEYLKSNRRDFKKAFSLLQDEIKHHPDNERVYLIMAIIHMHDASPYKDFNKAQPYVEKFLEMNSEVGYMTLKTLIRLQTQKIYGTEELEVLKKGTDNQCSLCAKELYDYYKVSNFKLAYEYLEKGSKMKHYDSLDEIIRLWHEKKLGDYAEVIKWYKISHETGKSLNHSLELAELYFKGMNSQDRKKRGVTLKQDVDEAIKIYEQIRDEGFPTVNLYLGMIHSAFEIFYDGKKAYSYAKDGMDKKDPASYLLMSYLSFIGHGTKFSCEEGIKYLNLARNASQELKEHAPLNEYESILKSCVRDGGFTEEENATARMIVLDIPDIYEAYR